MRNQIIVKSNLLVRTGIKLYEKLINNFNSSRWIKKISFREDYVYRSDTIGMR